MRIQKHSNDNQYFRQTCVDEAGNMPVMPQARYLIDKYVSAYWKNDTGDPDYILLEQSLCRILNIKANCIYSGNTNCGALRST